MIIHWKRIIAFVSGDDDLFIADYASQMARQLSKPLLIIVSSSIKTTFNHDNIERLNAVLLTELPHHMAQAGDLLIASWYNIKDLQKLKEFILNWPQPILLLKQECNYEAFKQIALCSDFDELDSDEGLFLLRDLAIAHQSELRIIHVKASKEDEHSEAHIEEAERELHFFQPHLTCKMRTVYAHHVYKGVKAYIQHKRNVDLVAVIRRKHNFLHEVLIGNNTLEISKHIQEPILIV